MQLILDGKSRNISNENRQFTINKTLHICLQAAHNSFKLQQGVLGTVGKLGETPCFHQFQSDFNVVLREATSFFHS